MIRGAVGINSPAYKGRDACIYDGWCHVGCPIGALANPLVTYLADAKKAGAEVRALSTVTRILTNQSGNKVTGVEYYDANKEKQVQEASVVVMAAWAAQNPRLMMNSELEGGGESRIIIPTVFRDDYIGGLRQLSRNDEAGVYVKAMRIGQDWTNAVDFSDLNSAIEELRSLNAFVDDGSARLLMPARFAGAPSTEFDEQARVSRRRR